MTEPGAVRVTVARVCPAGCEGGKVLTQYRDSGGTVTASGNCLVCHGRGVVWEPVTCAGCAHFGPFDKHAGWCGFWMSSTAGETPCAAWKPRES